MDLILEIVILGGITSYSYYTQAAKPTKLKRGIPDRMLACEKIYSGRYSI